MVWFTRLAGIASLPSAFVCCWQGFDPSLHPRALPRPRSRRFPSLLLVGSLLLASCRETAEQPAASLRMFDCVFQAGKHGHLHISESEARASLITNYRHGSADSHAEDLRAGRESEGRLVAAAGGRFVIALFLLNDHLGESAGETVSLHLAADGQARLEARGRDGQTRTIDAGTCLPVGHQSPLRNH